MSYLNVTNVSHSFGGRQILEDVSFKLLRGEHVGLVGANGEGKSTFLNIVTGHLLPDEGKVEWPGRVTVGYSAGETEFNAGGKTGGAKTHALTAGENGPHDHGVSSTGTGSGTLNHNGGYIAACGTSSIGWNRRTGGNGSGSPHNNLQPYITVFRWRRTA